jgi:hypothetical protein
MFDDKTMTTVLQPDADHHRSPNHRANGQFAKGNKAGPGRPSKVREKEVLAAINEAMPPEEITKLIKEMIDLARVQKSWRGMEAALSFCAAYQVGKPVQRIANNDEESPLDNILRKMRAGQPGYNAEGYPLGTEEA